MTAAELRDTDPAFLRKNFGVVMARIQNELRGVSCLSLESSQPRKQIISSRSFGQPVIHIEELSEAICHYTALACQKLRKQGSLTGRIYVFIQTGVHDPRRRYENGITLSFPTPLSSSSQIMAYARQGIRKIFNPGYQYKKAGVILLDLSSARSRQEDMLSPALQDRHDILSETADRINQKFGNDTVTFCAEGIHRPWKNRNDMKSPAYTTQWENLAPAYCK